MSVTTWLGPARMAANNIVATVKANGNLSTSGLSLLKWSPELNEGKGPPTILVIDGEDISRRVLRAMLKTAPYRILEAGRASEAMEILEREAVDLLILDLVMPEMSGLELCSRIKADRKTQLIPILMLTNVRGIENEIAGIASGADEFLIKPLHPEVVRTRIRAMLRNKAAIDSLEEAETILFALAQAVEKRDKYTGGHCQRLAEYSVSLGAALGLSKPQLLALHRGGFLHDIGKIAVPDAILFKTGPLTEEEWAVMRGHTLKGEEICQPMKSLAPVLPIIRSHHERWDGSGYPDRLSGEHIPLLARILQIADVYDALTTARPYKSALAPEQAFQTLEEEARLGWRDPELVSLFREVCQSFPSPWIEKRLPDLAVATPMQLSLENMSHELSK
jgi:putative two-component system response regulator